MTDKKRSKKKVSKPKPKLRLKVFGTTIELTPEVERILESNEAKLYITGIQRASTKLENMIRRKTAASRHPSHAG